ncbi:MAG: glycosyltransferase involved in cell wall biosynthesis [Planctomycetota bacterium]|jgi:glycosyltransferase involved in cell wall biosynthesis
MTTDPRVSIIIRTYNRPKMLRRALESVGRQTYKNIEAVVINDAGQDVQSIVDDFKNDFDILYLNYPPEDKPGRCKAANEGIAQSTGEWICYLDDDDFYYPDHIAVLMHEARRTGALVHYTDANRGTEEPSSVPGEYVITAVGEGPSEDFSRAGFYCGCYIHLVTFCHHRRLFEELGGFDENLPVLEDLDLFFRYAFDNEFHHIKQKTAQFQIRTDQTNAVTSMRLEFAETHELLCKKYLHTAVGDMMVLIQEGRARLLGTASILEDLMVRISTLEHRILELEQRDR